MLRSDPDALYKLRSAAGHSTRTLARAAELSHGTIVRLEGGSVPVKPATAWAIARVLGVTATDIATTTEQGAHA